MEKQKPSKIKKWKIFLNLILLSLMCIVSSQNAHIVDVELLFWEAQIPLVLLLVGMTVTGSLITLITVLIKAK